MKIGTEARPLRVAIVGSGPSGFYAAVALLNQTDYRVEVDVFDRLPTPYGLVRGGVAPDHQKIKSVSRVYDKAAANPAFGFFGNVELGRDVQVDDLLACYDQIVYALGNENDRRMGIPGETLEGCMPATVFVGWYNAHPDYRDAHLDFSCKRVAVVGNGNVAIDVTRILAKSAEELRRTDIADHALEALAGSRVEEIVLLGRRGPVQAAFSPAELKELGSIDGACCVVSPEELELDEASRAALDSASDASAVSRNYATLCEIAARPAGPGRRIRFRFRVSPVELRGDERGRVRSIVVDRNELVPDGSGAVRARGTGEREEIEVGRVFASIGYQGRRTPGLPFDEDRGVIPNADGRVLDRPGGSVLPNQYVVGWAKSGPRGLIGMHKAASGDVVKRMLEDVAAGTTDGATARDGREAMAAVLRGRGVDFVTFEEWRKLDEVEIDRGRAREAPRSKFATIPEMLEALGRGPGAKG